MHQFRWAAYSAPPDFNWILGALLLREGREDEGRKRKGRVGKGIEVTPKGWLTPTMF